jgi:sulfonate transport system ATP-binding protein
MLAIDHVGKTYRGGVEALASVTLTVGQGEFVAIVGGSGCGKSTLLRLVAGLDAPTAGRILLDGVPLSGPHEKVGMVFQEPRLLPWLTVAGNVGFGLAGLPAAERAARVADALARVGLSDKAGAWPKELSGGQAQRVALARALVVQPEVLLLDEPFSALDAFTRADLQDHLVDLWAAASPRPTMIVVTHDVDEAVALADRVVVLRPHPGRIAAEIPVPLARPRDRGASGFEAVRRQVLSALGAVRHNGSRGVMRGAAA